ncbi:MAG: nucleotide exchange factor GrpE [Mycoplasmataceae bacterium]|jgi:molecular chaperone GrpE|nr:nucleotide exchange factor GrpE [Mycoplasmataceae bacterium]
MKHKHEEQKEIKDKTNHEHKDSKKVEDVQKPSIDDIKKQLDEALKQIIDLTSQLIQKDNRISALEKQVEDINKDYVNKVQSKMDEANKLLKEKMDELNTKASKELDEKKKYVIEKQVESLINVVNQFELALSHTPNDEKIKQYQMGFKMFLNMLKDSLNELGINEININIGDEFNPKYMNCLDFVHSDTLKDNQVSKVITKAYKLYDRIIKTANVNVVRKKN